MTPQVMDLHQEISERLRRELTIDAACWHGIDPANVLMTTANPVELFANGFMTAETEPIVAGTVLASEYQRDDVNSFRSLAKRRRPSAILSETMRGRAARARVAVIAQATSESDAAPLRLEAFALSPREREVATLVAAGLDTTAISERLFISPWTVQNHCKAIFEKTGTRSRRELRAQVFFHDHRPAIMVQTPLDAGGHLEGLEPA